jgi:hypothetical protein
MRGERRDPTSYLKAAPDAGRVRRRCAAKWIRVFLVGRASVALKGFFRNSIVARFGRNWSAWAEGVADSTQPCRDMVGLSPGSSSASPVSSSAPATATSDDADSTALSPRPWHREEPDGCPHAPIGGGRTRVGRNARMSACQCDRGRADRRRNNAPSERADRGPPESLCG